MAKENIDFVGRRLAELRAQGRYAAARVDDEQALAAADLDAGRVAAELDEARPRGGDGPSHAPEADLERLVMLRELAPTSPITLPLIPLRSCRAPAHTIGVQSER